MARTPGATNKTPREKEAEAKRLMKEAKLQREIEKLKEERAELRKK